VPMLCHGVELPSKQKALKTIRGRSSSVLSMLGSFPEAEELQRQRGERMQALSCGSAPHSQVGHGEK
jgi:hypothetical protein